MGEVKARRSKQDRSLPIPKSLTACGAALLALSGCGGTDYYNEHQPGDRDVTSESGEVVGMQTTVQISANERLTLTMHSDDPYPGWSIIFRETVERGGTPQQFQPRILHCDEEGVLITEVPQGGNAWLGSGGWYVFREPGSPVCTDGIVNTDDLPFFVANDSAVRESGA